MSRWNFRFLKIGLVKGNNGTEIEKLIDPGKSEKKVCIPKGSYVCTGGNDKKLKKILVVCEANELPICPFCLMRNDGVAPTEDDMKEIYKQHILKQRLILLNLV